MKKTKMKNKPSCNNIFLRSLIFEYGLHVLPNIEYVGGVAVVHPKNDTLDYILAAIPPCDMEKLLTEYMVLSSRVLDGEYHLDVLDVSPMVYCLLAKARYPSRSTSEKFIATDEYYMKVYVRDVICVLYDKSKSNVDREGVLLNLPDIMMDYFNELQASKSDN